MMCTELTPLLAASNAEEIFGNIPPEIVPSANKPSISLAVKSVMRLPLLSITPGILVMMTNIPGVMDKSGNLLTDLTAREIDGLFADGTISGGMLPKISSALDAAKSGVNSVHIIDGRIEHSLLLEILTEQAFGTMIRSH